MKNEFLASSLFLTAAVSASAADSALSSADVMVMPSSNAGCIGIFVPWASPASNRSDALVVVLNNNRVSLLRLSERSLVEAALVKLRANAAKASVVARKKRYGNLAVRRTAVSITCYPKWSGVENPAALLFPLS